MEKTLTFLTNKTTANCDLRLFAKACGVSMWRIAEKIGISEPTFYRKLRHELPEEDKEKIRAIIKELAQKGA